MNDYCFVSAVVSSYSYTLRRAGHCLGLDKILARMVNTTKNLCRRILPQIMLRPDRCNLLEKFVPGQNFLSASSTV